MPSKTIWLLTHETAEHHQSRSLATEEHSPSQVVSFHEISHRSGEADATLFEEHRPLGDRGGDVERLLDDDQRHPLRLQALDDLEQALDHDWCKSE